MRKIPFRREPAQQKRDCQPPFSASNTKAEPAYSAFYCPTLLQLFSSDAKAQLSVAEETVVAEKLLATPFGLLAGPPFHQGVLRLRLPLPFLGLSFMLRFHLKHPHSVTFLF